MQGPFCRQRIYCLVFFTIMLGQSFVHAAPQVVPKGFGAQENSPSSPLSQNQFEKQFAQAVRAYKATLREQWPNAEVSSASRAVFYSQDLRKNASLILAPITLKSHCQPLEKKISPSIMMR